MRRRNALRVALCLSSLTVLIAGGCGTNADQAGGTSGATGQKVVVLQGLPDAPDTAAKSPEVAVVKADRIVEFNTPKTPVVDATVPEPQGGASGAQGQTAMVGTVNLGGYGAVGVMGVGGGGGGGAYGARSGGGRKRVVFGSSSVARQPVEKPAAATSKGAPGDLVPAQKIEDNSQNQTADEEDGGATQRAVQVLKFNPWTEAAKDHLSTFGMDVDTASYAMARGLLGESQRTPPPDWIRTEEFINYFDYANAAPKDKTFAVTLEACPNPLNPATDLVRIGVRARTVQAEDRKPANLVFVIDVSGSMQAPNRLPLVRASLHLLLDQLQPTDQVAIVIFSSTAETVLPFTSVKDKQTIAAGIDKLRIAGSTAMEAGMRMAYDLAGQRLDKTRINRVIVCTDGGANVGDTGPEGILKTIAAEKDQGVYLSTVGFGLSNYNDGMLETLADKGNGNYSHIDSLSEARRVFVEKVTGTLMTVAKDAKIQVDFNPGEVAAYRLIGYEDRDIADQDFRNDNVDGGEVGAGQTVTALYEIRRVAKAGSDAGDSAASRPLATVQIRYKDPVETAKVATVVGQETVHEEAFSLETGQVVAGIDATSLDMKLTVGVAQFAEVLRKNPDLPPGALAEARRLIGVVAAARGYDDKITELVRLMEVTVKLQATAAP